MLTFFVLLLIIILIVTAVLMHRKLKEAKAQNARLLSLNQSARQLQEKHVNAVETLVQTGLIDTTIRKKFVSLGNNYFVFQSINEVNVAHFVEMTQLFSDTIVAMTNASALDEEACTQVLQRLANKIPDNPRDFSAGFYMNVVPGLMYDFSQAVAELEPMMEGEKSTESVDPVNNENIT
jgi:hypothetical protein